MSLYRDIINLILLKPKISHETKELNDLNIIFSQIEQELNLNLTQIVFNNFSNKSAVSYYNNILPSHAYNLIINQIKKSSCFYVIMSHDVYRRRDKEYHYIDINFFRKRKQLYINYPKNNDLYLFKQILIYYVTNSSKHYNF